MATVMIRRRDSLLEDFEQLHRHIASRAHQLFLDRDGENGDALGDWLAAERALLRETSVDVSERGGAFVIVAHLPALRPKDLFVDVSGQDLVLRASAAQARATKTRHTEMTGELFERIQLPEAIDADRTTAEYRRGVLTVTVPIARSNVVGVKAA